MEHSRRTDKPLAVGFSTHFCQNLASEILANKIASTYLIFSSDNLIIDEIVKLLKENLLTPGSEPFDYDHLHCSDYRVNDILNKVFTPALRSAKRLVVIKDILTLAVKDQSLLLTELAKPRNFSVAVVATEWEKNLSKLVEDLMKDKAAITVYNFYKPFRKDLKEQVRIWAQRRGMTIDSDAIDWLIEIAGESQDILNGELEKLQILLGPGKRITEAAVKKTAAQARDYELTELISAIMEKESVKSLRILFHLKKWGEEPVKIIGWVGNEMFRLLRVMELGYNTQRVAKEFGYKEKSRRVSELINRARHWTRKSLNQGLVELATLDKAIKRGHPEPYFLLENFLIRHLEH